MSNAIELLKQERPNGRERLVVRWTESEQGYHGFEIGIERREGAEWRRSYFVTVSPAEVFRLHDAVGMALWHASQVQK
jgi:hypothetical protein